MYAQSDMGVQYMFVVTVDWRGELRPLADVAREQGVPYDVAFRRFKQGWAPERIFALVVFG